MVGFLFQNLVMFSFAAKKRLGASTFMPLIYYGDVLYMHASSLCLLLSECCVHHGALRFITNLKSLTHHCSECCFGWSAQCYPKTEFLACPYV